MNKPARLLATTPIRDGGVEWGLAIDKAAACCDTAQEAEKGSGSASSISVG